VILFQFHPRDFEKHSSSYKKKKQWDDQYFKNKDKIIKDEIEKIKIANTKYLIERPIKTRK